MPTVQPRQYSAPLSNGRLEIALPEPDHSLEQDAEWCVVRDGDRWRRIRFHDYESLFSIPGLYEKIIYDVLKCRSPRIIVGMLRDALRDAGTSAKSLRVFDLGAGNGIVAQRLTEIGVETIVGVDIIEEAARAADRDRSGVYENYHVCDLTALPEGEKRELAAYKFNCLTCVAALGFGDIPTEAFRTAYNLIEPDGWVAFNIKEDFLANEDTSGFAGLIRSMKAAGTMQVVHKERFQHRMGTDRQPIHYVGIIARKRRDIA
ncbi:MAG: class I SAM-dependent methyltransferase [Phycisphaerales bacterium]|nr:class I SAM-dependent methyltransferase [Phycisphaerales bacterium]